MFNHIEHDFPKLLTEEVNGKRMYVAPNGKHYPSVTTVLADYGKEGIMEWRKRVGEAKANEISRKATTRGTGVHKALELYLKNQDISSLEMLPNVKSLCVRMKDGSTREFAMFFGRPAAMSAMACLRKYGVKVI